MAALFPGYVGELGLGGDDLALDRRDDRAPQRTARASRSARYLTTDHVLVEDDYSDTQLAELFLHHRVLIVPIATGGRVHAVVTRHDFFALADRFGAIAEDLEWTIKRRNSTRSAKWEVTMSRLALLPWPPQP